MINDIRNDSTSRAKSTGAERQKDVSGHIGETQIETDVAAGEIDLLHFNGEDMDTPDRLRGRDRCGEKGCSSLNQVMLNRKLDQVGRVLDAELVHDIAAMHFHCPHANAQVVGDMLVQLAAGDQL